MTDTSQASLAGRVKTRRTKPAVGVMALRLGMAAVSRIAPDRAAAWLMTIFTTPRRHRVPEREVAWMAGATRKWMAFDSKRRIPVYEWGEGPTVLLAHGFSGRASQMGAFVAPLVDAGFRVVAFDAPAHGQAEGKQTALPEMIDAIVDVAGVEGPLEAIVGHSLGAASTVFALQAGVAAKKTVLIAPPDYPGTYLKMVARFVGASDRVEGRAQARIERTYGRAFEDLQVVPVARGMTQTALVLHDAGDSQVPYASGRGVAEAWPDAELVTTEGLGHNRILRDPAVAARIVAFLTRD